MTQKIGIGCVILASFATLLWSVIVKFYELSEADVIFLVCVFACEVYFANLVLQSGKALLCKIDVWRQIMVVTLVTSLLAALSELITNCDVVANWGLTLFFSSAFVWFCLSLVKGGYNNATKCFMASLAFFFGVLAVFSWMLFFIDFNEVLNKVLNILLAISGIALLVSFILMLAETED